MIHKVNIVDGVYEITLKKNDVSFAMIKWSPDELNVQHYFSAEIEPKKLSLTINNQFAREALISIMRFVAKEKEWPIYIELLQHPGFPAIRFIFNDDYVSETEIIRWCEGLLELIKNANVWNEVAKGDESDEFDEEVFDTDNFVTESQENNEWEDSVFDMGEIVEGDSNE